MGMRGPTVSTSFQDYREVLISSKRQEKKDGEKNKDERQNSLFVDNIIV